MTTYNKDRDQIIRAVCKRYRLDPALIFSSSSKRMYSEPRMISLILCRYLCRLTLKEASGIFGKHHTYYCKSLEAIQNLFETDSDIRAGIVSILDRLILPTVRYQEMIQIFKIPEKAINDYEKRSRAMVQMAERRSIAACTSIYKQHCTNTGKAAEQVSIMRSYSDTRFVYLRSISGPVAKLQIRYRDPDYRLLTTR